MNNIKFNKGAILEGQNNSVKDLNHYIVFYEAIPHSNGDFIGGMISTKPYGRENIPMKKEHFEEEKPDGSSWKIYYKGSYLVPARLYKFNKMGPFTQFGQLTQEGIDFMASVIEDKPPMPWEDYLKIPLVAAD
jgi:hypothetical protein